MFKPLNLGASYELCTTRSTPEPAQILGTAGALSGVRSSLELYGTALCTSCVLA
jgi:hypothetical protein